MENQLFYLDNGYALKVEEFPNNSQSKRNLKDQ